MGNPNITANEMKMFTSCTDIPYVQELFSIIIVYLLYKMDKTSWRQYNNFRYILCASEVSANLYCNSRTSVLERLRDYLRLLMGRTLYYTSSKVRHVLLG